MNESPVLFRWTDPAALVLVAVFSIFFTPFVFADELSGERVDREAMKRTAYFAGGCFWCVESDFEKVDGVLEVINGYTGGELPEPTYDQVTSQTTGHREAVKITYDPNVITYQTLVELFFRHVDPLDDAGQFCDRGESYTTAIWVTSEEERRVARIIKANFASMLDSPVVTPILDAGPFWQAEPYHQDFYIKNPVRYRIYRGGCGRNGRVGMLNKIIDEAKAEPGAGQSVQ